MADINHNIMLCFILREKERPDNRSDGKASAIIVTSIFKAIFETT